MEQVTLILPGADRAFWEDELKAHRELLRNVAQGHREVVYAGGYDPPDEVEKPPGEEELVLEEVIVYPPLAALRSKRPPKAVQGPSGWVYHSTSFGFLRPHDWPRSLAISIVEAPLFDPLILLTIMCNCTTMAWASPLDPPGTEKEAILAVLEWVYLYVFTFELLTKMVAYGLVMHDHSYLRDAWCQLDFVVVSLAWLPIFFPATFGNMSAIRSVRALRPLRALKRVPGMPVLVGSILQSLPPLGTVVGLTFFFFIVFGIVGVELFKGVLHYRCADPDLLRARELSAWPDPTAPLPEDSSALSAWSAHAGGVVAGIGARANDTLAELIGATLSGGTAAAAAAAAASYLHAALSGGPGVDALERPARTRRALRGGGGGGGGGGTTSSVGDEEGEEEDPDSGKYCMPGGDSCAADGMVCHDFGRHPSPHSTPKPNPNPNPNPKLHSPNPGPGPTSTPQVCHYFEDNPNGGTTSFDNVVLTSIALMQALTFDTWTDPMFGVMNAYAYVAWVYFILAAIVGGEFHRRVSLNPWTHSLHHCPPPALPCPRALHFHAIIRAHARGRHVYRQSLPRCHLRRVHARAGDGGSGNRTDQTCTP